MLTQTDDIQIASIDTRALSNLIIEFNISRRNFNSYPKGHPVIAASFKKVLDAYSSLLATTDEITIGVARDSLMVEGVSLEKSNLVYRDFAGVLFDHGIASLLLRPGLSQEELSRFTRILALKREDVQRYGGIERLWTNSRISSLLVKPVRYDLFSVREGGAAQDDLAALSPDSLWEQFARALSQGETIGGDGPVSGNIDPVVMAQVLNSQFAGREASIQQSNYARSISDFMRQDDAQSALSAQNDLPYQRVADFVSNLNPELRRQFLSSSLEACYSGGQRGAEKMVSHLSTDVIMDTLAEVNANRIQIPSVIMNLLQSLGRHAVPLHHAEDDQIVVDDDELGQKMRTLFREHVSEEFVPEQYQNKLNSIIVNEQLPQMDRQEVEGVLGTLEAGRVEGNISDIIMQLIMFDASPEESVSLGENLNVMCSYFLETGDYEQLLKIIAQSRDERIPESLRDELDAYFKSPEFLKEILNGLHVWGKSRLDQIKDIVQSAGEASIDVLLDALAEEENMSLRRFIMDRLTEFGKLARQPIIDRLSDNRWYVLRNLVVLLRLLDDATVLEVIRPMQRHTNQRLRQEVQRTLLHFNDTPIEQQILCEQDVMPILKRLTNGGNDLARQAREVLKKLVNR